MVKIAPVQTNPMKPYASMMSTPQSDKLIPSKQDSFHTRLDQGTMAVRHHGLNIALMGASTLLFPLFPKPFKMSMKHSLYMAPVHMAMMAGINFMIAFAKGTPMKMGSPEDTSQ
jgi:hypothetical protein